MDDFVFYKQDDIKSYISFRDNETKIGEKLIENFQHFDKAKYVIIGIPEDFGPRANFGLSGANMAFDAFLKVFVNMQYNEFCNNDIYILGEVKTDDLYSKISNAGGIDELRKIVEKLDVRVAKTLDFLLKNNKIPIIIGGGHNNCYPIIQSFANYNNKPINVMNIDPHCDLRPKEGRHSGNGFSYAIDGKYLNKYYVFGAHKEYNSQYIINTINTNPKIKVGFYDEILKNYDLYEKLNDAEEFLENNYGLEIDTDVVSFNPASAFTTSGFNIETLRTLILNLKTKPLYIHISESAPKTDLEKKIVGKNISYIVSDFISLFSR